MISLYRNYSPVVKCFFAFYHASVVFWDLPQISTVFFANFDTEHSKSDYKLAVLHPYSVAASCSRPLQWSSGTKSIRAMRPEHNITAIHLSQTWSHSIAAAALPLQKSTYLQEKPQFPDAATASAENEIRPAGFRAAIPASSSRGTALSVPEP